MSVEGKQGKKQKQNKTTISGLICCKVLQVLLSEALPINFRVEKKGLHFHDLLFVSYAFICVWIKAWAFKLLLKQWLKMIIPLSKVIKNEPLKALLFSNKYLGIWGPPWIKGSSFSDYAPVQGRVPAHHWSQDWETWPEIAAHLLGCASYCSARPPLPSVMMHFTVQMALLCHYCYLPRCLGGLIPYKICTLSACSGYSPNLIKASVRIFLFQFVHF